MKVRISRRQQLVGGLMVTLVGISILLVRWSIVHGEDKGKPRLSPVTLESGVVVREEQINRLTVRTVTSGPAPAGKPGSRSVPVRYEIDVDGTVVGSIAHIFYWPEGWSHTKDYYTLTVRRADGALETSELCLSPRPSPVTYRGEQFSLTPLALTVVWKDSFYRKNVHLLPEAPPA